VDGTSRGFSSPVLDTGEKYTHVFEQPGSYDYRCTLHPFMKGTITITREDK